MIFTRSLSLMAGIYTAILTVRAYDNGNRGWVVGLVCSLVLLSIYTFAGDKE